MIVMTRKIEMSVAPRWLIVLIFLTLLVALLTTTISSYIRLADSGLGCKPWPACYGQFIFNENTHGTNILFSQAADSPLKLPRVLHRLGTSLLGLMILAIFLISFSPKYPLSRRITASLMLLTVALAAIGQIHPSQPTPLLTLANLTGGFALVALLYLLLIAIKGFHYNGTGDTVLKHQLSSQHVLLATIFSRTGLGLVILLILFGGWTSANYAANSCDQLMQCQTSNALLPAAEKFSFQLSVDDKHHVILSSYASLIQWTHHLIAIIALVFFGLLVLFLMKKKHHQHSASVAVFALLLVQFLLGFLALVTQLPLLLVVAHNVVAALLLIAVIHLNLKSYQQV